MSVKFFKLNKKFKKLLLNPNCGANFLYNSKTIDNTKKPSKVSAREFNKSIFLLYIFKNSEVNHLHNE